VEKRYLRADGAVVWAQVNAALLRDETGAPIHRVTQQVDITARKERERNLERAAAAEREVAAQLRRLDEITSAFLDAVSHELRTPLTVILGMAETLQQRRDRLQPPERDQLEDLLELERLGRGGHAAVDRPRARHWSRRPRIG
jgi:signal transduction histidine kinase